MGLIVILLVLCVYFVDHNSIIILESLVLQS